MNFFKSILSDDPDSPKSVSSHGSDPNSPLKPARGDRDSNVVVADADPADGWSFGGLIKTFANRSESLIETYRRDLEEFGSGLRKETEIIREAASRAVKDLPASLEAGSSVLDGVLKSTAEILSTEVEASASGGELEVNRSSHPGRYSRSGAQLSAIRSDLSTFCEEPEDVEEYEKWKLGFRLEDKRDEIEGLIGENGDLEGVYAKVVPGVVDREAFFCRYFYRVEKLEKRDRVRADFVKRAVDGDDDNELSWDVDDEGSRNGLTDDKKRDDLNVNANDGDKQNVVKLSSSGKSNKGKDVYLDDKELKFDEKLKKDDESCERENSEDAGVVKIESGEKCDVSMVSNREAKTEEDDLGWGEIEDNGNDDEKKIPTIAPRGRPNGAKLREQLNGEEDDEDLSWDIEDDDDPVKS